MSIISLIADPIPFLPKGLEGDITDFNKQILMTELTKGVWDSLKLQEPDYLILDFYSDVFFGVRRVGDSFITDKTSLFKKAPLYSALELGEIINLEDNHDEYMKLWKESIHTFMNIMGRDFPNIKIIVNKIHFTDMYIPKGQNAEMKKISDSGLYKKVDVDQVNQWLDEFYLYMEENFDIDYLEYDKEYVSEEQHIWEFYYVHYTKDYYEDFTTRLLSVILADLYGKRQQGENQQIVSKPNDNLIRNSTFNLGNAFWTFWQDDFKISAPESDSPLSNILSIQHSGLEKDAFRQIWSHPVEINTNGNEEFTVSFDIKIHNVSEVDSLKFVFSLRTYNKIDHVYQKDAVWYRNIKVEDISNLEDNKWVRVSYTFKANRSKFLKLGPYLIRNGNISWRNIKLEKGSQATPWVPSYRE
jgi:hypothetical protein